MIFVPSQGKREAILGWIEKHHSQVGRFAAFGSQLHTQPNCWLGEHWVSRKNTFVAQER